MIDTEKFLRDGWVICDLPNPSIVKEWSSALDDYVHSMTGFTLNNLDKLSGSAFKEVHIALSEYIWAKDFSTVMGNAMLPLLKELIGLDIMVQTRPYFRLARPNKPQDNIGYHRDTSYGQTPYEMNVHIPFMNLDAASALRVISGSHLMSDSDFGVYTDNPSVEKGSIENRTGRPYAPKRLRVPHGMGTEPLVIKAGQVAFFSPALFHGQEINNGTKTRISVDWHGIAHSRAPIIHRNDGAQGGYKEIAKSPVEQQVQAIHAL